MIRVNLKLQMPRMFFCDRLVGYDLNYSASYKTILHHNCILKYLKGHLILSYMEAFTVGVKCVGEVVALVVVFVLDPVFAQSA